MLIITASTMSLLRDSIKASNVTYEMSDAQQSLRTAQEFINRDLLVAGDGLNGINTFRVSPNFIANYLTTNTTPGFSIIASDNDVAAGTNVLQTTPAVTVRSTPNLTDRITILEMDRTFTPVSLTSSPKTITTDTSNNATLSVPAATYTAAAVGDVYFINSSNGATFGIVTGKPGANNLQFNTGDTYGINNGSIATITNAGASAASLMRMKLIHYFVNSSGLLIRRVFGVAGKAFNDDVVAEHVVDLQFRYITNDASANGLVRQPATQLTTGTQQVGVREVEVTVTTETVHPIVNKQRQTLSMTATTGIRNMQFRQALVP
jgi:hypothetical protein